MEASATAPGATGAGILDNGSSRGEVTNAKLRLLEARLMGDASFTCVGASQQQQQQQAPSRGQSGVLTVRNGAPRPSDESAARAVKGTPPAGPPGNMDASNAHLVLSSPPVAVTPPMQVDASLDSEWSQEVSESQSMGGGDGAGGGRWGIQVDGKRRRVSTLGEAVSRSRGIPIDAIAGASRSASQPAAAAGERDGSLPEADAAKREPEPRKRKSGKPRRMSTDRGTTPTEKSGGGVTPKQQAAAPPKQRLNTINRYFQAAADSCSNGPSECPSAVAEDADNGRSSSQQIVNGPEAACQTSGPSCQELEDANAKLRLEVEDLAASAEERSSEAQRRSEEAEEAAAGLRAELDEARAKAAARDEATRTAVRRLVRSRSRSERRAKDASLQQDALRLGSIGVQRTGAILTEVWTDGPAFHEVRRRLAALADAKEEIEALRKSLKKQLPLPEGPKPDASSSGSKQPQGGAARNKELEGTISPKEYVARDEVLKVRLAALKREEDSLGREKERLEVDRLRHIRDIKRRKDEDDSRFSDCPELHDRYVLMSLLGKGGFSEVYRAFDAHELREVAVKIHQLNSGWSEAKKQSYVRHAVREYNIHKELRHPRVVRLLDIFEVDNSTFATVLEVCEGGDLEGHLREHTTLPEREARAIASQILQGLAYLNEPRRRIIHYDLKPANIMFDSCGEVKITDFGLSKIVEEGQTNGMELTSQGAGTYWYLPPECFEMGGATPPTISSKVDVWSVGVIFYQMLYGKRPFGHDQSQETILREKTITNSTQSVEFPSKPAVSQDAKDFIRRCLAYRQANRPDVHQAAADTYIVSGAKAPERRTR